MVRFPLLLYQGEYYGRAWQTDITGTKLGYMLGLGPTEDELLNGIYETIGGGTRESYNSVINRGRNIDIEKYTEIDKYWEISKK